MPAQPSAGARGETQRNQETPARYVLRRCRRLEGNGVPAGAGCLQQSHRPARPKSCARIGTRNYLVEEAMKVVYRVLGGMLLGCALGSGATLAATFRFADQGDALSMDPHSLNESLQLNVTGNMYEPLVGRGKKLELVPLLATSWKQTAPTVWRFNLRQGVKFHDGSPFTAADVLFSYQRSKDDGSDMKTKIASVKEVRKIDDYTVEFVTNDPFPIL